MHALATREHNGCPPPRKQQRNERNRHPRTYCQGKMSVLISRLCYSDMGCTLIRQLSSWLLEACAEEVAMQLQDYEQVLCSRQHPMHLGSHVGD